MVLATGARIHIGSAVEEISVLAGTDVGTVGRKQRRPAGDRVDEVDGDRHEHEQAEENEVRQQEDVGHPPLADQALKPAIGQSRIRVANLRMGFAPCG